MLDERSSPTRIASPTTSPPFSIFLIVAASITIALIASLAPRDTERIDVSVSAQEAEFRIRLHFSQFLTSEKAPNDAFRSVVHDHEGTLAGLSALAAWEAVDQHTTDDDCDPDAVVAAWDWNEAERARLEEDAGVTFDEFLRFIKSPDELDVGSPSYEAALLALGYGGELRAVSHRDEGDAQRAAVFDRSLRTLWGTMALALIAGIGGALGGIRLVRLISERRMFAPHLESAVVDAGIYVESFAVFAVCNALIQVALVVAPRSEWTKLLPLGLLLAIPFSLLWPVLRGVRWSAVRRDLGLVRGAGFVREALAGVGGYFTVLPIALMGVALTAVLQVLADQYGIPTYAEHPDTIGLGSASAEVWVIFLINASIVAPLTEEALFRGALYRDTRRRYGPVVSGLLVGVLFAMMHPQGWVAIPALTALALGFALIREHRESLIAPMVAHALHNGAIILLLYFMVG